MKVAVTIAAALAFGCPLTPTAIAQAPALLSIQTYPGLAITGAVGTVYSVEYITDLAQSSTPSAWRCLEFLQLPATPYLWSDRSAPATGQRFYRAEVFLPPTNMAFIPPGTFRMGSPTNEEDRTPPEGPQTTVIISRGFWMGKYELTQGEYLSLMNTNPSLFTTNDFFLQPIPPDLARPVERVSWFDATNYCGQLTQQERAAGRIPTNCVYRLPTEAEWEYACRALTSDRRFFYGDDPGYTNLSNYAWYSENNTNFLLSTQPVGRKLPNPWGLYDVYGNVSEWCQDLFVLPFPGGILIDPVFQNTGTNRVPSKGGHWADPGQYCRSAMRIRNGRGDIGPTTGFRVVLAPR